MRAAAESASARRAIERENYVEATNRPSRAANRGPCSATPAIARIRRQTCRPIPAVLVASDRPGNALWWHARDSTISGEADQNWLAMGTRHVRLFADYARAAGIEPPVDSIVDWGCGGGANAVAFAGECRELWGVDVSADALAECGRQLAALDPSLGKSCDFHPVSITVPNPETALAEIPNGSIDLFVCFYVFELLPSPEHGARVLRIAHKLLRPGGVCFVQIKYQTDSWKTRARRWGYARSAANMTTYRVEAFWELAEACGFEPKTITLVPKPPEVPDVRYAYFMLQKPSAATNG